jgi:pimeloyl-ACP methyl ester carboxylesterase
MSITVRATVWLSSLLFSVMSLACRSAAGRPTSQPNATARPAGIVALRESVEVVPALGGAVYVLEAGAATAPPLVMIHGLGERAARDFDPLLPALSARFHVLTFDLPGFGRSTHTHGVDYSPDRYIQTIHALIASRFKSKVAVLGHSMGGALAILYASSHPDWVERLLLLDVAGVAHYRGYVQELLSSGLAGVNPPSSLLRRVSDAVAAAAVVPLASGRLERLNQGVPAKLQGLLSSEWQAALMFVRYDFSSALRSLRAPTWIGWGKSDTIAPLRTADALRYLLHPLGFTLFEASAHVPMRSEPAAVVKAVSCFLDSPLQPRPAVQDAPLTATRVGVCTNQADRSFEGDYASIAISSCRNAVLRDVRTRLLQVRESTVELTRVDLLGTDVALRVQGSRVRWTGGLAEGAICFDMDGSRLDLMAVTCAAKDQPFRVQSASRVIASISRLQRAGGDTGLYGDFALEPTPH